MKINLIIILLLLAGSATQAQTALATSNSNTTQSTSSNPKVFASAGCVELGGGFSFNSESVSSPNGGGTSPTTSLILFAPYVGVFPVKGFEIGLNPFSIESASYGPGSSTTALLFILAPSYNFNTHSIAYPFIEGNIGYNSNNRTNATESGVCYGVRGGVKLAIASHALLNIAVQYLEQTYSSNGISEGTINNLVVGIGFTVNL
jgi:hypothetical protein